MKRYIFCVVIAMVFLTNCQKPGMEFPGELSPSSYPSDVVDKWLTLEIRLFRNGKGISNGAFARPFAYSGISAFESTDPGRNSWKNKYNGLSSLPARDRRMVYHWPSSVNASLAEFNRSFFTTVNSSTADVAAIDSLENAIKATFSFVPAEVTNRSISFGKSIADAIFSWSQTDQYNENNALPYTPLIGPGLWEPTPPSYAKAIGPFWGNDRTIIAGSGDNVQPPAPTPFSTDPNSAFYKMVNDLYKASKSLTTDQKNWALFWRDVPGVTTPGHWMSIVQQVIRQTDSHLDRATMAFALVGLCLDDANISVMKTKYTYNLVRPVTYIRETIGDTAWLSFITTPAHPEYLSAHSAVSAAAAEALTAIYGNIGSFTDHTGADLGFPARTFKTFRDIAVDAGNSRFYGGIHYQPSIDAGLKQGRTVGDHIIGYLGLTSVKEK